MAGNLSNGWVFVDDLLKNPVQFSSFADLKACKPNGWFFFCYVREEGKEVIFC